MAVLLSTDANYWLFENRAMVLRIIAGVLLLVWLALVLMGKGGFVHILLLNAIGIIAVEVMTAYRSGLRA